MTESEDRTRTTRSLWIVGVIVVAAAIVLHALRFLTLPTEPIQGDEFALLARAAKTLATGEIVGGGRPGLVPLVLTGFVRDCSDSVIAVVAARHLWFFVSASYLVGIAWMVRNWSLAVFRKSAWLEGFVAAGLTSFVPFVVMWSQQVRTDQPALAASAIGGALLLMPRPWAKGLAGALMGAGILCSQKAIYFIAAASVLYAGAQLSHVLSGEMGKKKVLVELFRDASITIAALVLTICAYLLLFPEVASLTSGERTLGMWQTMQLYRKQLGYGIYTGQAPQLLGHAFLAGAAVIRACQLRASSPAGSLAASITSLMLVLLSMAVVWVHGSAFPYFWMTVAGLLSLSVVVGAASPSDRSGQRRLPRLVPLLASFLAATLLAGWLSPDYRYLPLALAAWTGSWLVWIRVTRRLIMLIGLILSIAHAIPPLRELLAQSNQHQRDTMRLIRDTNLTALTGYQVEGALFCTRQPLDLPFAFSQQIQLLSRDEANFSQRVERRFRDAKVAYIVESYRMALFPEALWAFWKAHYVRVGGSVLLAGRRLEATDWKEGQRATLDIVAPGSYVWLSDEADSTRPIWVDGTELRHGESIRLEIGPHRVSSNTSDPVMGTLVLDVGLAPTDEFRFFY